MKTIFTYIKMNQNNEEWEVLNRFSTVIIGIIKWSPFANEYCYYMNECYWHKTKVLSETNLIDICKFIKKLKKPEDIRFPK